jgi:murein DD-endopeptidase MepM/ murein hydrolase activator NlpD
MLAVIFAVVFALSSFVVASNVSDLKDQKSEVDSQLEEKQDELDANQAAQNDAQAQLEQINTNLDAVQAEIDTIYSQLKEAEANLAQQQEEYEGIQASLAASQAELRDRVNAIYKNGDVSYLDVLFSSENIQDFISGFVFLGKIVNQDQSIINSINENRVLAEKKLNELEVTRNQIASLQEQKEAEEKEYLAQVDAKSTLLAQLGSEEDAIQAEIDEMQSQSASIASEINSYYASISVSDPGYTYTGSGAFTWPLGTSGRITSPYGNRIHPISGTYKMHTGVDIAAPKGTPVLAAESGTVITVKELSTGYGHYVVISHGSNIVTLYGHMSAIYVSVGETVSRGQQIGGVGTTGSSTGNHLHFEVRQNGSPVNPMGYIS